MESCIICNKPTYEMNDSKQIIHDSCMANYHAHVKELIKVKGCCMCGNTNRKLTENTCNKCIKLFC